MYDLRLSVGTGIMVLITKPFNGCGFILADFPTILPSPG